MRYTQTIQISRWEAIGDFLWKIAPKTISQQSAYFHAQKIPIDSARQEKTHGYINKFAILILGGGTGKIPHPLE
jgi:hypothetical protein